MSVHKILWPYIVFLMVSSSDTSTTWMPSIALCCRSRLSIAKIQESGKQNRPSKTFSWSYGKQYHIPFILHRVVGAGNDFPLLLLISMQRGRCSWHDAILFIFLFTEHSLRIICVEIFLAFPLLFFSPILLTFSKPDFVPRGLSLTTQLAPCNVNCRPEPGTSPSP